MSDSITLAMGYSVRRFLPEDAAGVTACVCCVYGDTYGHKELYHAEQLLRLNETGELVSVVALESGGQAPAPGSQVPGDADGGGVSPPASPQNDGRTHLRAIPGAGGVPGVCRGGGPGTGRGRCGAGAAASDDSSIARRS